MENSFQITLTILFVLMLSYMGVWMKVPSWKSRRFSFSLLICTLFFMGSAGCIYWIIDIMQYQTMVNWWDHCIKPVWLAGFAISLPIAIIRFILAINYSVSRIGITFAYPIWISSAIIFWNLGIIIGLPYARILKYDSVHVEWSYFVISLFSIVGSIIGMAMIRFLSEGVLMDDHVVSRIFHEDQEEESRDVYNNDADLSEPVGIRRNSAELLSTIDEIPNEEEEAGEDQPLLNRQSGLIIEDSDTISSESGSVSSGDSVYTSALSYFPSESSPSFETLNSSPRPLSSRDTKEPRQSLLREVLTNSPVRMSTASAPQISIDRNSIMGADPRISTASLYSVSRVSSESISSMTPRVSSIARDRESARGSQQQQSVVIDSSVPSSSRNSYATSTTNDFEIIRKQPELSLDMSTVSNSSSSSSYLAQMDLKQPPYHQQQHLAPQLPSAFAVSPNNSIVTPRQRVYNETSRTTANAKRLLSGTIYAFMAGLAASFIFAHQLTFIQLFPQMFSFDTNVLRISTLSTYIEACIAPLVLVAALLLLFRMANLLFFEQRRRLSRRRRPDTYYSLVLEDANVFYSYYENLEERRLDEADDDIYWDRYDNYRYMHGHLAVIVQVIRDLKEIVTPAFVSAIVVLGAMIISISWIYGRRDGSDKSPSSDILVVISSAMVLGVYWWGMAWLKEMAMTPMINLGRFGMRVRRHGNSVAVYGCRKFNIVLLYSIFMAQLIASYFVFHLYSWNFGK